MDKLLMKYFKRTLGILVKKNFKIENTILTAEIEYGQKVTIAGYLTQWIIWNILHITPPIPSCKKRKLKNSYYC